MLTRLRRSEVAPVAGHTGHARTGRAHARRARVYPARARIGSRALARSRLRSSCSCRWCSRNRPRAFAVVVLARVALAVVVLAHVVLVLASSCSRASHSWLLCSRGLVVLVLVGLVRRAGA